ncbi:MAG: 50S ribosomal protein L21e [Desulfurococcaceae archaeon]
MVKAPRGYRHRTRKLLRKRIRDKGAVPSLSLLMIKYKEGDRVHIVTNPSIHRGIPHRRYHGKTGIVIGKRGRCYIIKVWLGDKEKTLFIRPEHLRPATHMASERIEINPPQIN